MTIGKNTSFSWDYSETSDILNIRQSGKTTAGGAELGDFSIDFDKNGDIVGVEVINASDFFSQVGIGDLTDIKAAEIIIQKRDTYSIILLKFVFPQKTDIVPIPAPIVAEVAA